MRFPYRCKALCLSRPKHLPTAEGPLMHHLWPSRLSLPPWWAPDTTPVLLIGQLSNWSLRCLFVGGDVLCVCMCVCLFVSFTCLFSMSYPCRPFPMHPHLPDYVHCTGCQWDSLRMSVYYGKQHTDLHLKTIRWNEQEINERNLSLWNKHSIFDR